MAENSPQNESKWLEKVQNSPNEMRKICGKYVGMGKICGGKTLKTLRICAKYAQIGEICAKYALHIFPPLHSASNNKITQNIRKPLGIFFKKENFLKKTSQKLLKKTP